MCDDTPSPDLETRDLNFTPHKPLLEKNHAYIFIIKIFGTAWSSSPQ